MYFDYLGIYGVLDSETIKYLYKYRLLVPFKPTLLLRIYQNLGRGTAYAVDGIKCPGSILIIQAHVTTVEPGLCGSSV